VPNTMTSERKKKRKRGKMEKFKILFQIMKDEKFVAATLIS
jgi:hypothetical protein